MVRSSRRIGLALSGGGIRAAIFHLGVFKWLAEQNMLEQISHISSVSGGSLIIGLIYSANHCVWPKSEHYLKQILPQARERILTRDIQASGALRLLMEPWNWDSRVSLLARTLQDRWGIQGSLEDLPKYPQWTINCTTFETGKDFRFSQNYMGDCKIGCVHNPDFPISEAVAASAGFPVLIGPYKMSTKKYRWHESRQISRLSAPELSETVIRPRYDSLHLWDGGVYDNLGLEALYQIENSGRLTGDLNYLIISNASSLSGCQKRHSPLSARNLRRLLDIKQDQVSSLRSRDVLDFFQRSRNGYYIKIGTPAQRIAEAMEHPDESIGSLLGVACASAHSTRSSSAASRDALIRQCLSPASVEYARNYPTVLSSPTVHDFDLLLRHGYETAKCTAVFFGLI